MDLDRIIDMMEEVGFLDDSLRVANNEVHGHDKNVDDTLQRRRVIERMVRDCLEYNEERYSSRLQYESAVLDEIERRLSATTRPGCATLSAVITALKKDGVHRRRSGTMDRRCIDVECININATTQQTAMEQGEDTT